MFVSLSLVKAQFYCLRAIDRTVCYSKTHIIIKIHLYVYSYEMCNSVWYEIYQIVLFRNPPNYQGKKIQEICIRQSQQRRP